MNSVDPRDRADWHAHHPAPASWANDGPRNRHSMLPSVCVALFILVGCALLLVAKHRGWF